MVSRATIINVNYKQSQLKTFVNNIVILNERVQESLKKCHKHLRQIDERTEKQIMDSDQAVPNKDYDCYKEIVDSVNELFGTLSNIQNAMDKIVIKIKQTERQVRQLNRAHEITHRYNDQ
jgi:ribosomal protein S20